MLPVLFRDEAEEDIDEAVRWYDRERPGLGNRFIAELRRASGVISENPEAFVTVAENVRRYQLEVFPYGVFYRIHEDCIEVIAVIHGARHPSVARRRMR